MPRAKRTTTSPTTAVTRFNAVRHGLTSDAPVIPGVESQEDWEAHRDAVVAGLSPQDPMESVLTDSIASLTWRIRRVQSYETAVIAVGRERVEFDYARTQAWGAEPPTVEEAERRLEDAQRRLDIIENLTKTPRETRLATTDVESIFEELAGNAGVDTADYLTDIETGGDSARWTVGELLATLQALAARDGDTFAEMLTETAVRARITVNGAQLKAARFRAELDRMYRERILPAPATLDLIIRYEANLNRMFHQALSQLEAMQSRRQGAPTPLHRVQAYGLPGG